ncbi:MAG TPA: hypothetical protein VEY90_04160 [Thermoleophilaceae bacterium]|nr:hypothetical protein [Thermoleophilaceae bacterium]
MRPARSTALWILLLAIAGCDSGSDPEREPAADRERDRGQLPSGKEGRGLRSYEGRVIRGWLLALNRGNYGEAAYYFARGALIDQGEPFRLESETAARTFNAGLPCRADLVRLEDEGRTVLASFALRPGPGGPCAGRVRVRYTIRKGKFTEWRQLEQQEPPAGETI